ncbi:MAG TPA: C45 family peptidase [Candidatus Sulfomarinibacteraceae bacterium]|nr:C45 family peptidase [Candidatus Sulfomarinibacteraceae bacterium]
MPLPTVRLSGTPHQQGRQHGAQLRQRIRQNLDIYFERFLLEGKVSRDEVLQRAARYAVAIADQNPDYAAGMRGIAEGAGLPLEDIVALNVRYEILYYQYAVNQMASADGCTAFALSPEATADGRLLLGQNWDWIPGVRGALLHTTYDDGLQTLAFTEAGIFGGKIGLNSAGVGLVINGITSTDDDWSRLGRPFHLRCYEALRQRSLQDARTAVMQNPVACSANFLIAQLPDRATNVEVAPAGVYEIPWQQGCLVHANHFVEPSRLGVHEPPDDRRLYSCRRQERLERLLAQRPVLTSRLQTYLKDHTNAPRSICRHEEPSAPIDEQYRTVASIIIDLTEGILHASDGPPCDNDYEPVKLNLAL